MYNPKNPTAFWFARMDADANLKTGDMMGSLARLMEKYFAANYGKTKLPKVVADFIIYDQLPVATTMQFFQNQWTALRSNFPNSSFIAPESEHMVIQGFRFMQAVEPSTTINEADWQPGIFNKVLKNATFQVTINGIRVMTQVPLTAFDPNQLSATVQGSTDDNRGFFYLMEPLVLLGQTSINIDVSLPPLGSITTNLAMRVELHGQRFIGN